MSVKIPQKLTESNEHNSSSPSKGEELNEEQKHDLEMYETFEEDYDEIIEVDF